MTGRVECVHPDGGRVWLYLAPGEDAATRLRAVLDRVPRRPPWLREGWVVTQAIEQGRWTCGCGWASRLVVRDVGAEMACPACGAVVG